MKYYAVVGQSTETVDGTKEPQCPVGHIEMKTTRPTPKHIANKFGDWVLPPEQVVEDETDTENAKQRP